MRNFQELIVWQKAHQLTLKIYSVTSSFPTAEVYGLTSQIRRSCSSIPTNIAEGCGRHTNPDLKRFLTIASGSCSELEYQLILSKDLSFISLPIFQELTEELIEIRKMLFSFISKLS